MTRLVMRGGGRAEKPGLTRNRWTRAQKPCRRGALTKRRSNRRGIVRFEGRVRADVAVEMALIIEDGSRAGHQPGFHGFLRPKPTLTRSRTRHKRTIHQSTYLPLIVQPKGTGWNAQFPRPKRTGIAVRGAAAPRRLAQVLRRSPHRHGGSRPRHHYPQQKPTSQYPTSSQCLTSQQCFSNSEPLSVTRSLRNSNVNTLLETSRTDRSETLTFAPEHSNHTYARSGPSRNLVRLTPGSFRFKLLNPKYT